MTGELSMDQGLHGDRIRVPDEYHEYIWRCDRHIADAEGDAPLQALWFGMKCEYQAGPSGQVKPPRPFP